MSHSPDGLRSRPRLTFRTATCILKYFVRQFSHSTAHQFHYSVDIPYGLTATWTWECVTVRLPNLFVDLDSFTL